MEIQLQRHRRNLHDAIFSRDRFRCMASIQEWRSVLKRAKQRGEFVGVDEKAYPRDFASMMRYYTDLKEKVSERYSLTESLTLEQLDRFIEEKGDRFPIQWLDCNLS